MHDWKFSAYAPNQATESHTRRSDPRIEDEVVAGAFALLTQASQELGSIQLLQRLLNPVEIRYGNLARVDPPNAMTRGWNPIFIVRMECHFRPTFEGKYIFYRRFQVDAAGRKFNCDPGRFSGVGILLKRWLPGLDSN